MTTYEPTLIAMDDGGSVKLSCTVDRCSTFKHKDRQCEFHYDDTAYRNSETYPVSKQNCDGLKDIVAFDGDYYHYNCAIKLGPISEAEKGLWFCHFYEYNGAGYHFTYIFTNGMAKASATNLGTDPFHILLHEIKPERDAAFIEITTDVNDEKNLKGYGLITLIEPGFLLPVTHRGGRSDPPTRVKTRGGRKLKFGINYLCYIPR